MKKYLIVSFLLLVVVLFSTNSTSADTTVGTNLSTTGTLKVTIDSETAVRFQNAAGTVTTFFTDTTNRRVGIGGAPSTTFEAQGTSSASYFLTGNTLQVAGFTSAAYSRFGTNTTTGSFLADSNDVLISGNLEVDLKALFDNPTETQGTASASYFLTGNTLQVAGFASVAYSRFGTNATTHAGTISGVNDLLITGGLEINGSTAFDGFALFSAGASITTNFELTTNSRFGINAGAVTDTSFEVGGTASISGVSTWADGQFRPGINAATAFRFQNAAGTTSVFIIDTTNKWVGIGATPQTTFEVQGTSSASYFLTGNTLQVGGFTSVAYNRFGTTTTTYPGTMSASDDVLVSGGLEVDGSAAFDSSVSVSANFEIVGARRVGINAGVVTNTTFEVGGNASISGIASISGNFAAGLRNTGTSSFEFDAPSSTQGACIRIKDVDGSGYTYLRVSNGIATFTTVDCRITQL